MKINITKLSADQVICKQPDRYIGWPSLIRTSNDELIAVFSGDREFHVCPYGKVQMVRSKDNGKTWTNAETICNTPLDDRDSGILETDNGTLIVSWFTSIAFSLPRYKQKGYEKHWQRLFEKISTETQEKWLGSWVRRSVDNGKTWEKPIKLIGSAPHGPIKLKDGRLINIGMDILNPRNRIIAVEESVNDGKSWNILSLIPFPTDDRPEYYVEPHIIETENSKLIALIRYHRPYHSGGYDEENPEEDCYMRITESMDGGKSWTIPKKTCMKGFPPHLLKLDNGWLLNTYNIRFKPNFGERACISRDNGKTWDIENEIVISESKDPDLGYPATAKLDDGSFYTVYYQKDKLEEKPCLMGTHWRINGL